MTWKIQSDVNRFKDIIRKKVKNNLSKHIASDHIIGQEGGKIIK